MLKKDTNPTMKILNPRAFKFSIKSQIEFDLNEKTTTKHFNLPSLTKNKMKFISSGSFGPHKKQYIYKAKIFEIYNHINKDKNNNLLETHEKLGPIIVKINESLSNLPTVKSNSRNYEYKKNNDYSLSVKQIKIDHKTSNQKNCVNAYRTLTFGDLIVNKDQEMKATRNFSISNKIIPFDSVCCNFKKEKGILNKRQINSYSKFMSINHVIDKDFHFYSEM
jgi:hypothetical protein